jgi:hypothetical protein
MSLHYYPGNQTRAARIARELVSELAPTDLDCVITESMGVAGYDRLFMAVNEKYLEYKKTLSKLDDQIRALSSDELRSLFHKYSDVSVDLDSIKEIAFFNLGFAAALRLVGAPPTMDIVTGGNREPRLKGKCAL